MLSENLHALAASFGRHRDEGLVFEPVGVATIEAVLLGLARQALALEQQILPAHARLDPDNLPAGVIPFRPRRRAGR
ncbi:MAG: hypothetical protein RLZZ501_412 [Pseudomonadota bacterium]|jgi:uncharacterized membrane protein